MTVSSAHDLFGLDPSEFVAARDALARTLRHAGDREQAAAVKALRRPAIPVWALNQVARARPDLIGALVDAGAHATGATGDRLRGALTARRELIQEVVRAGRAFIEGSGRAADAHDLDLTNILNAVLGDDSLTGALCAGKLSVVDTPSGGVITWPETAATGEATGAVAGAVPARRAPRPPSRALVQARREVERRRAGVDEAVRRRDTAQHALEAARDALREAEARLAALEAGDA